VSDADSDLDEYGMAKADKVSKDEDILARVKKAKEYVDQAVEVCEQIFVKNKDELILAALKAVENTATDLKFEAWDIYNDIKCAMRGLEPAWDIVEEGRRTYLGTRQIPTIEGE